MIEEIRFYLKLIRRRLPVMVALVMICSIVGFALAVRTPVIYRANATLLVEPSQIPNAVRGGDQDVSLEQLEVIQRQLLTRANLLDIARENRIIVPGDGMSPDEAVQKMRASTRVRRSAGRNRATTMAISFTGDEPKQVAEVVNGYVTLVLAFSNDFRAARTQNALRFFEQEVDQFSRDLELQSEKIVAFKTENSDALPESLQIRLNQQSQLQERIARAERDLEGLEERRAQLIEIYEENGFVAPTNEAPRTPQQRQLAKLEADLRNALVVYSEQNPRVKLIQARIEAVRTQIASGIAEEGGETLTAEEAGNAQLQLRLAQIDAEAETLQRNLSENRTRFDALETSVARTASIRIELESMERERINLRSQHGAAVQRLNQARLSERIEVSARGGRITVLEPPSIPSRPANANRMAVAGTGMMIGVGLAGAFFILMELLNSAIRRPSDITSALQVTPLASLPLLETQKQKRIRRLLQIGLLLTVLLGIPAVLWAIDSFYQPLDILVQRLLDQFL